MLSDKEQNTVADPEPNAMDQRSGSGIFKKSGTEIRDRHIISKELFVDSLLRIKIRDLVLQCLIRDRHPRSETREYFNPKIIWVVSRIRGIRNTASQYVIPRIIRRRSVIVAT